MAGRRGWLTGGSRQRGKSAVAEKLCEEPTKMAQSSQNEQVKMVLLKRRENGVDKDQGAGSREQGARSRQGEWRGGRSDNIFYALLSKLDFLIKFSSEMRINFIKFTRQDSGERERGVRDAFFVLEASERDSSWPEGAGCRLSFCCHIFCSRPGIVLASFFVLRPPASA